MRQWLYGADLVFRVFGRKVITPLLGFGLSGIRNRYFGDPIQASGFAYNNQFTQNVLAADGLAGLELNLSKHLSLSGRFKIYSQLTNRSRYNVYPAQSSGSQNEYYQVLGGLSFRM
ncbi:MAG: hypothetical protein HY391_05750 [Deltaproteobacteria bacterium]|nr:hypothetical protein [Deltaproteobacteria bacterium]